MAHPLQNFFIIYTLKKNQVYERKYHRIPGVF